MNIQIVDGVQASLIDPQKIPWPADSIVAVASNGDGSVKGRSAIIQLPHIEGTWVDESERGTPLAYRMVVAVEGVLKKSGKTHAFAFVDMNQPEVLSYMLRMGYKTNPLLVLSKEL